jgi:hypothetical protein
MAQLHVIDPQQIEYENDLLKLTILGGVKLEGLDRLRVTLRIEVSNNPRPPVRHNLDLYNDNQLEKFIRKCAEKLETGTTVIAASISELTTLLEQYRLQQLKLIQTEETNIKKLSPAERTTAIENLQQENLMQQTLEDLQETGIQGEEDNMQIVWYVMTSRKTNDPLSLICLARSGTGKSYLMEKVAYCIPDEDRREHTQFSGNSLYYFKREEIKGTVFLIEDLDGAQAVMFPIRELQSKKRISKTVTVKDKDGQLRTVTLIVEGPVTVIGCTTREKVYEDNANRAILIYLDDSKEQDERVMQYQKQLRAKLVNKQREKLLQEKLQNMQRVLEPVMVVNPYAVLIDLPKEMFKPRRSLPLLLGFIEAITFYHQYQREHKTDEASKETYIEVHPIDIEAAFTLLKEVLFRKSDELSTATRDFYEWLKQFITNKKLKQFYGSDIRKENRIHPRTLSRYLQELTDFGLLQIAGGNKHRTGYSYKIITGRDYKTLQDSISKQIEEVMQKIWEAHNERIKQPKPQRQKPSRQLTEIVSQ